MARHLRIEFQGAIYHVTVRMLGDWKQQTNRLFEDDADCERFVSRLAERVEQYDIRLYLYCLLTNHVHLVFETPEGNCARFMQALTTAYTVYFNLRHRRHGHLVDGRYKAKVVEGDDYLLALSRYVHGNPAHVGAMASQSIEARIRHLRHYPWSSYPSYIGQARKLEFVDYSPVLAAIATRRRSGPGEKRRAYRAFVESGLAECDDEFTSAMNASPRSIGSDSFRAWVDELYQKVAGTRCRPEDIAFRRITEPLAPEVVLRTTAEIIGVETDEFRRRRRNAVLRGVASRLLLQYSGLTQRATAEVLGMGTGAAVSVQRRKLDEAMRKDGRLRRQVATAAERLDALRRAPGKAGD